MYLPKKEFNKIKEKFNTLLLLDRDVEDAMEFVRQVLEAEADALKQKEPHATVSIRKLEEAAYEIFSLACEIGNEEFGEE